MSSLLLHLWHSPVCIASPAPALAPVSHSLVRNLPSDPLAPEVLRKGWADRFKSSGGRVQTLLSVLHENRQQRSLPRPGKSFVTPTLLHLSQQTLLLCRHQARDLQGLPAKPGSSLSSSLSPSDASHILQGVSGAVWVAVVMPELFTGTQQCTWLAKGWPINCNFGTY